MKPAVLLALILITFLGALHGEFLYDDEFLIQKNAIVQNIDRLPEAFLGSSTAGSGGHDSFYRPLQIVSYSLIHSLFGLDPFWFHLFNVILHGLNAVLLFYLIKELFLFLEIPSSENLSFLITLVWSLHPIHTEAISYISATADPLHFFFGLLFVSLSLRKSMKLKFLGLVALGLACLSKEAAVTFPGLLFSCVFVKHWSKETFLISVKKSLMAVAPALALALVYVLLRGSVLDFDHSFEFYKTQNVYTASVLNRVYTGFAALTEYLQLLLWPSFLQIDRSFPVYTSFFNFQVILGFCLFVLSLLPFFLGSLIFSFFSLWFWSYHLLNTGIILPLNSLFLEHWMYIPSVGVIGSLVTGGSVLFQRIHLSQKYFFALVLFISLALALRTWDQNAVWESPVTLYEHILIGSPKVARVHNNLAMALSDKGEIKEAEKHYLISLEIDDTYPQTWHNLGLLYLREGKLDQGISDLEKATKLDEHFSMSYLFLAKAYELKGLTEKAKEALKKYHEFAP